MEFERIAEFEAALAIRAAMGRDLVRKSVRATKLLTFAHTSVVRDYYLYLIKRSSMSQERPLVPPELIEFFVMQDVYFDQNKTYQLLNRSAVRQPESSSAAFSGLIYLGWTISKPPSPLHFADVNSRLDSSLIHQSHLLYNGSVSNDNGSIAALASFVSSFLSDLVGPVERNCLVEQLGKRCIAQFDLTSLDGLSKGLLKLKRLFCFILGSEVFNSLQMMLSPHLKLTADAHQRLKRILYLFRCEQLYRNLLLLRTISGESTARTFLLDELRGLSAADESEWLYGNRLDIVAAYELINGAEGGVLRQTILKLAVIADTISSSDVRSFVAALADLQASDTRALYFVNWTQAQRMLDQTPRNPPHYELAAGAYFLSYCQWEVHRVAATNKGQGNFIAKLSQTANDTKRFVELEPKIDELCRRVARFPRHQAKLLSEHILRRDILRLLPYFGSTQPLQDAALTPKLDRQISHIRFQLAQGFHGRNIINKITMQKYTYEELEYLKLLKFYENDRKGRVRVDWTAFRRELSAKLSTSNGAWYKGLLLGEKSGADSELIDIMAEELALEWSEDLLFRSANSLDWCLSNHVRHGHIVSTFLGAVHQAIDEFAAAGVEAVDAGPTTERYADAAEIRRIFGTSASTMNTFMKEVVGLVDTYKDGILNFDYEADIHLTMTSVLKQMIVDFIHGEDRSAEAIDQLQERIVDSCNTIIEDFLDEGRRYLKGSLLSELTSAAERMRVPLLANGLERTDFLIPSIQSKIGHAADTIDAWLHQNQSALVAQDFKLQDIANYLMATVFSSYGKEMPPQFSFFSQKAIGLQQNNPDIDGAHFDFFLQVIFNAMQNAFVHSGRGRKTACSLEMSIMPSRLTFRISSILSDQEAARVRENYHEILQNAQNVEPAAFAYEGGSGIAKIKRVAKTIFNVPTQVAILPMSPTKNRFTIEYRFPVSAAIILPKGARI